METIFSYTNDQAVEDGCFADITPNSLKPMSWRWLVSVGVCEHKLSIAAFADMFNSMVNRYNRGDDVDTVPYVMNGVKMWCFFESEGDKHIFKVILPSEY